MQAAWVAALTVSFMLSGNRMDASAQNAAETVQERNGEKVEDQKPQQPEEEQENTWENHADSEEISEEIVEETAEENSQEITEEFLEETEIEVVAETETEAEVIAETKTEEVTEEIHDQDTEESEQELILEPEYQPEKDPNPLANNILQYLGEKELEQIRNIELPDRMVASMEKRQPVHHMPDCSMVIHRKYRWEPSAIFLRLQEVVCLTGITGEAGAIRQASNVEPPVSLWRCLISE